MYNLKYALVFLFNILLKKFNLKIKTTYEKILESSNKIILVKQDGQKVVNPKVDNLNITFKGHNNCLEIHEPFVITKKLNIFFGSNGSTIKFNKNCKIRTLGISIGLDCLVEFGEKTSCANTVIVANRSKGTSIKIGKNCMFSTSVHIRCTDSHVIYDKYTNKVLNFDKDVIINDNVWLGHNVTVTKGAVIPSNCVVGTCSLINKVFEKENCILAGNPAKIIKENIAWDREMVYKWIDFSSEDCAEVD